MERQQAHVLVLSYPAQGHINPLLQFAKCLSSRGLRVSFATTLYTVSSIQAPGIDVFPISDGFDKGGFMEAPSLQAYIASFRASGSKTVTDLIHKLNSTSGLPITCLIYDSLLTWGLEVAKGLGILAGSFMTNSVSVCSVYRRIDHGMASLPVRLEDLPVLVPGISSLGFEDMPSFLVQPPSVYLEVIMEMISSMDRNDFVLANTFEELENEVSKAVFGFWPVQTVGPVLPSAYLDKQFATDTEYGGSLWEPSGNKLCTDWLNGMPPNSVVYISFGSMAQIPAEQAEQVAHGLIESGISFLWVVREPKNQKLLNELFHCLDGYQAGLLVPWCNQLEVLSHGSVGCFVTHCGWNSTLEAVSIGVPVVAMPQGSDQPMNAKLIEGIWKVGVRAKKDEFGIVGKEEVKRCIGEVMNGEKSEELRENALKWRDMAKNAISPGGSSHGNVNKFIQALLKEKSSDN